MPQESLRSVVYRSFVTCDDPKGVAECKTIRKSKGDSKNTEDKIKNKRTNSNSSTSLVEEREDRVPKDSTDELQKLSSFRIMEVSRGAEKLNEVIGSWSGRPSVDRQSKYIAKDLLRGALDLQESLVMLGKLQEASNYIAKSTRRHKEKPVGGRDVDAGVEFADSDAFGDDNRAMEMRKRRESVDRSSKDCYDELREVIRESFARQNLLPRVSSREKDCLDRKNAELCMDFPSSSSSQSSLICSNSSNCSLSSVQHERAKGPNLIAKLMGLEEAPSKGGSSITFRQMKEEKLSDQRSFLLDIDLPRPKKPQFVARKVVRERRTLEEMIETMQFKGLLARETIEGSDDGEYDSDVSFLRRSLDADGPPIVIMRPLRVHDLRADELRDNHLINEEKHFKSRQMPQNMRERLPSSAPEVPRGKLKFTEKKERVIAGGPPKQKLDKVKEEKHSEKFPVKPVKKTPDTRDGLSSMKINHSKPLVPRMQKKEAVVRKNDDKPKFAPSTKKRAETKDAKSQGTARTQDSGKPTTLKLGKAVKESNVSKSPIAREKVAAPNENTKRTSPKSSLPKRNPREGKPNSNASAAVVENVQSDDNLRINTESSIQGSSTKRATLEASREITEEVMDASCISISDNSGKAASSPRESSKPISTHDLNGIEGGSCINPSPCESPEAIRNDDPSGIEESSSCIPSRHLDETNGCISTTNTRNLLLSSASFLNHVEGLFDTGTCTDLTVMPAACSPNSGALDDSLLLDCAEEILERKSTRHTRMTNPFSRDPPARKPKCHLFIEELVGEVCEGIEDLRNYSKSCGDIVRVDSIHSMLERDLWRNQEATGAWDLGWRNGYTAEAVDEVVRDIEKLVLSEFVADVVTEFKPQ